MKVYRQGDIALIEERAPDNPERWKMAPGWLVLARGEESGHEHVLFGPGILCWPVVEHGQALEVWAPAGARLEHPEHGPIDVPPGAYKILRQRQYKWPDPPDYEDDPSQDWEDAID